MTGEDAGRSDATLVAAAASGDESAFRLLYRAYARPVYWFAHSLVHDTADAEDVLQETFLVAWRKLPGLELSGDSLLPWLVTICRFHAANRLRRRQRERRAVVSVVDEQIPSRVDVAGEVVAGALVERILSELAGLSELDREIFRLCATDGLAYEDAAARLGVSHGTVRNRLSRVRTRLRAVVGSEDTA